MSILIRQKKSNPSDWHVAAQGSDETVEKAKMNIGRADNSAFSVDRATGDLKGNKTTLSVFKDKSAFQGGDIAP